LNNYGFNHKNPRNGIRGMAHNCVFDTIVTFSDFDSGSGDSNPCGDSLAHENSWTLVLVK